MTFIYSRRNKKEIIQINVGAGFKPAHDDSTHDSVSRNNPHDEIKELCGSYLPFITASSLCNELVQQIKKEKLFFCSQKKESI